MRFLKSFLFWQVLLCIAALIEKYFFIGAPCACFPNDDILFYLISFATWVIGLVIAVLSLANKNWKFIPVVLCIPITLLIANRMDYLDSKKSDNEHTSPFSGAYNFYIENPDSLNTDEINGLNLYLYKNEYVLIMHMGPECGCYSKGTFSFRNDSVFFDRDMKEITAGIIPGNFIAYRDYRISHDPYRAPYQCSFKKRGSYAVQQAPAMY